MKIDTIGGGPGGLYASLLLKKMHPDWEVNVYERNPPDVTYGWGIVFPNRTLSNLREADEPSHQAITNAFNQWGPFDIYYGGDRYRCEGHRFASMMRTDLVSILQDRCAELGVDLHFETEINDPASHAADADLLIAADGIHSPTREVYADEFGTETIRGEEKFSWFGTNASFEALSHIFVENDDGIWCAHTYPGRTSTFIIDCDAETWANAQLDDLPEAEYLDYLEELFASYLDGHELLSQQDRWQQFTTVQNETWYHENIVLVGDAAHTAHYSIGSGTTLALEDGIGLVEAFEAHDDLDTALSTYEAAKRPFVENLQSSAERSRQHFENIRRFTRLDGWQFAAHHLTRSGRLTYNSLRERDPAFVENVDKQFAKSSPQGADSVDTDLPAPRYQSFELGDLRLRNRLVDVVEPKFSATDGVPSAAHTAAVSKRSSAEASLVLTDPLAVSASGRITAGSPGLYDSMQRDRWAKAVERLHEDETKIGAHLVHAGQRAASDPRAFAVDQPMSHESAWSPRRTDEFPDPPRTFRPTALSSAKLDEIRDEFVEAARHADEAGFDFLQLHAGHGYLLSSFLSPLTNERTDEYGGSLANRLRFPLAVVEAVRDMWPDGKPLGVTVQAADWASSGLQLDDAFAFVQELDTLGCDIVAPVAGGTGSVEQSPTTEHVSTYSDNIRNEVAMPTLATPHTASGDKVDTLVATGRADLCVYSKFDIADGH